MMFASSSTAGLAPPTTTKTKSARRVRVRARGAVVVRAGRFETERTYIMIKCVDDSSGRMNDSIRFDDGASTRDDVDESSSEGSSGNASVTSRRG